MTRKLSFFQSVFLITIHLWLLPYHGYAWKPKCVLDLRNDISSYELPVQIGSFKDRALNKELIAGSIGLITPCTFLINDSSHAHLIIDSFRYSIIRKGKQVILGNSRRAYWDSTFRSLVRESKDQDILIIDNIKGHLTNVPSNLTQKLTFSDLQTTILSDTDYEFNALQKKAIDSFRKLSELAELSRNFDGHTNIDKGVYSSKPYIESSHITCLRYEFLRYEFHDVKKHVYDWTFKYDDERNYYYVVDNLNKKQQSLGAWKKEMSLHK